MLPSMLWVIVHFTDGPVAHLFSRCRFWWNEDRCHVSGTAACARVFGDESSAPRTDTSPPIELNDNGDPKLLPVKACPDCIAERARLARMN